MHQEGTAVPVLIIKYLSDGDIIITKKIKLLHLQEKRVSLVRIDRFQNNYFSHISSIFIV